MTYDSIVVARSAAPQQLVLLFHGVGSSAASLVPLGRRIARERPQALVVSVDAARPSSLGSGGREWFSVAGVTEANRPERIAGAMPAFDGAVRHWQAEAGRDASATTLVGFSQGAIMSLESTQGAVLAQRVIAIAGRFAEPPRRAPADVSFRFVHGLDDPVIEARFSVQAAESLRALGGDASAQLVPGLGHGIDDRATTLVLQALA